VAEWCELEKIHLLGMEIEVIRQLVDCFALEKQTFGPLAKDLRVDDRFSSRVFGGSSACVSRDAEVEVDASMQGESSVVGLFLELLGRFSKALVWVCGFSKKLGFKSFFGLKRRVGHFVAGCMIKRYKAALKGFRFRARSNRLVLKPNAKRPAVDSGLEPSLVFGADVGWVSGPGAIPSLGHDQISLLIPEATFSVAISGLRSLAAFQVPSLVPSSRTLDWILFRRFLDGTLLLWHHLCTPLLPLLRTFLGFLSLPPLSHLCKSLVQFFLSVTRGLLSPSSPLSQEWLSWERGFVLL
jgi:hypothetical protein